MGADALAGSILLIDDDPALYAVLIELLAFEGFKAQAVASPAKGLLVLQEESFDLVLTDSFAHVYSQAAIAGLQQLVIEAAGTPVVLFTAHGDADRLDLAKYGLSGRLLKPFDADDLLSLVRRYVMPTV